MSIMITGDGPVREVRTYFITCADGFERTADYPIGDRALRRLFAAYPRNDELESALVKVAALNALYRTQILDVYGMGAHIVSCRLDPHLKDGRHDAVGLIRHFRKRDCYSFATKYCHWHRPDVYPMYDRFVVAALQWLSAKLGFRQKFAWDEFRDYDFFVNAVEECRRALDLRWRGYKRLDQGLWILGQIIEGEADTAVVQFVGSLPD
jgi:hypothetical protein